MSEDCQSIIGAWTVGTDGHCIADEFGFPVGLRGFRYAVLEARLSLWILDIRASAHIQYQIEILKTETVRKYRSNNNLLYYYYVQKRICWFIHRIMEWFSSGS